MPGLAYHLADVPEDGLLGALGLDKASDLEEGSWYELVLKPGASGVGGDLYDPKPVAD
jgi:hypothetical protein